jgi:Cof subfamily protein (haloacid dehalogenase superfamily)
MSDRVVRALADRVSEGLAVILCTGRSPNAAEPFRAAVGAGGPMVFYNGAAVVEAPSGRLLASTLLSAEIAAFCASLARRRDVHFHAFLTGDRLVHGGERAETESYRKRTGLSGETVDLEALFGEGGEGAGGCIKGMFIAEGARLDALQKEISARFGSLAYLARSHATFLEVMATGVSKGNALKVALSLRGISREETVAFGDAENDIPMLEAAGWAVAVANAEPAVKAMADETAPSVEEDGVADWLERAFAPRA